MTCRARIEEEIHKGDIGTEFVVTFYDERGRIVDITDATVMQIIWARQDGTETKVTNTATLYTDGKDGKVKYRTTAVGELDFVGMWLRQGYVEVGAGKWHSDIKDFEVHKNIE